MNRLKDHLVPILALFITIALSAAPPKSVRLFDVFQRGHLLFAIYADRVSNINGLTCFFYHDQLVTVFHADSGLIWKEIGK